MLKIITGKFSDNANNVFYDTFLKMYKAVTGQNLQRLERDDGESDLVLIGNTSTNETIAQMFFDGNLDLKDFRMGTDDFCIKTFLTIGKQGNRKVLVLYGGRTRSVLYAVYTYFEDCLNCRYFYDGDRIPHSNKIPLENININKSSRFDYRAIRYFAHRSLKRFQAEHWSLKEWKREIDWILKKRLNTFMLRIGFDDVFQKAFPEAVPYEGQGAELVGDAFRDRRDFWDLKYRGKLRKRVLDYAFNRDLMHMEDCGTMTHWYSRTPPGYLDYFKPKLLGNPKNEIEATETPWDPRVDENLENYFKLTDTHIKEYGRAGLFHMIGLAERTVSKDPKLNFRVKKYVYDRVIDYIKKKYPNSKLFLASWDFWWTMQSNIEGVKDMLKGFDPEMCILLDYTSDAKSENNFTNWGVVGKFPYTFGVFQGFERDSGIRGDYKLTQERMEIAKKDHMCKGMVFWPELSHGDCLMTEYFAKNSFDNCVTSMDEFLPEYCKDRYGKYADEFLDVWKKLLPITSFSHWSMTQNADIPAEYFFHLLVHWDRTAFKETVETIPQLIKLIPNAKAVLKAISKLSKIQDRQIKSDIFDIARTVINRYMHIAICQVENDYNLNRRENLKIKTDYTYQLGSIFVKILQGNKDYSLYHTLQNIKKVHTVREGFEETLKINAENGYCRSYIFELAKYVYLPEVQEWKKQLACAIDKNEPTFEVQNVLDYGNAFRKMQLKDELIKTNFDEISQQFDDVIDKLFSI